MRWVWAIVPAPARRRTDTLPQGGAPGSAQATCSPAPPARPADRSMPVIALPVLMCPCLQANATAPTNATAPANATAPTGPAANVTTQAGALQEGTLPGNATAQAGAPAASLTSSDVTPNGSAMINLPTVTVPPSGPANAGSASFGPLTDEPTVPVTPAWPATLAAPAAPEAIAAPAALTPPAVPVSNASPVAADSFQAAP
jgi:hypothetical protein